MAKNLKKVKKGLSPKTKNIIVNSFKGIISNQACIDNGKEAPWWLAVLFLIFAVLIPLIPNHVAMNNAYGSSFLNAGTFDVDRGLAKASLKLKDENKSLKIEGGNLHYYEGTTDKTPTALEPDVQLYQDTSTVAAKTEIKFTLYFSGKAGGELNDFINSLAKTRKVGTVDVIEPTDPDYNNVEKYIPSFMVLTPSTVRINMYKYHSTAAAVNTPSGVFDWLSSPQGDMLDRIIQPIVDIKKDDGTPKYGATVAEVVNNLVNTIGLDNLPVEAKNATYNVWKGIFNEAYFKYKNDAKWKTTLIYFGVYAGLMFFLGLMIFLLTRGKNNPFRVLNFWVCQKIGYFLSFTPAVLALIVGFIFSTNMIGQMAFIMLLSLRVMWASMRQLRPVY